MKILVTGFEPFGGGTVNASREAVCRLPERIGEHEIYKRIIPTIFGTAAEQVMETAESISADAILCIGQAGGRAEVNLERIGINVRSARIPDNAGNQPVEEPVVTGGPDGLFATVPVAEMVKAVRAAGLPGTVSNSAGTYVCNDVLYTLLYKYHRTSVRVGFIHVPWLPGQGQPCLDLEETVRALVAAIQAI